MQAVSTSTFLELGMYTTCEETCLYSYQLADNQVLCPYSKEEFGKYSVKIDMGTTEDIDKVEESTDLGMTLIKH